MTTRPLPKELAALAPATRAMVMELVGLFVEQLGPQAVEAAVMLGLHPNGEVTISVTEEIGDEALGHLLVRLGERILRETERKETLQ